MRKLINPRHQTTPLMLLDRPFRSPRQQLMNNSRRAQVEVLGSRMEECKATAQCCAGLVIYCAQGVDSGDGQK